MESIPASRAHRGCCTFNWYPARPDTLISEHLQILLHVHTITKRLTNTELAVCLFICRPTWKSRLTNILDFYKPKGALSAERKPSQNVRACIPQRFLVKWTDSLSWCECCSKVSRLYVMVFLMTSAEQKVLPSCDSMSGCLRELQQGTMPVFHSGRKLSPRFSQTLCRIQQATTTLDIFDASMSFFFSRHLHRPFRRVNAVSTTDQAEERERVKRRCSGESWSSRL